jgi:hypothetical protein
MATTAQTLLQDYAAGKKDFPYTYLPSAILTQTTLFEANLSYSYMPYAQLWFSNLGGVKLSFAFLPNASLANSYLGYADLRSACLSNADLSNADLTGADLSGADLSGAKFSGATLAGVNFTGAILDGADFTGAKFDGVIFPDTNVPVLASSKFDVPANQIAGVSFTNPVNAEVTVVFTPSGRWTVVGRGDNAVCTSAGLILFWTDPHKNNAPYPNYNLGALVAASNVSNVGIAIDSEKRVRMKPNETLTFMMNDDRRHYGDNVGAITVSWKVLVTS